MAINDLILSYPDFIQGAIMDPEQFDTNNAEITAKVNEVIALLNDPTTDPAVIKSQLDALQINLLELDNTTPYTPTLQYHPATKGYVDGVASDFVLGTLPNPMVGLQLAYPNNQWIDQHHIQSSVNSGTGISFMGSSTLGAQPTSITTFFNQQPRLSVTNDGVDLHGSININNSSVESIINDTYNSISNNRIMIDELFAIEGVSSSINTTDSIFYDFPLSTKQLTAGIFDMTKGYASAVTTGVNTLTIDSMIVNAITDFKVGQEVTLQDGSNKEVLTVQSVADPVVTFTSNIVNTYSAGANLYRSNLKVNGDYWEFGTFSSQEVVDYTTLPYPDVRSGIAMNIVDSVTNRHTATLDAGEMIHISATGGVLAVYHSIDKGLTWNQLTFVSDNVTSSRFGIVKNGRKLGIVYAINLTEVSLKFLEVDYDTVTNTDQIANVVTVDTLNLIRREAGIAYVNGKYWILSHGWVTSSPDISLLWESTDGITWTLTELSQLGTSILGVRLCCDAEYNGKPIIIEESFNTSGSIYQLWVRYWNGSAWDTDEITAFGTTDKFTYNYAKFSDPGKIGIIATYGSPAEIYYIEWDNGVFSSQTQVTTGSAGNNTFINIQVDDSDVAHVAFRRNDTALVTCDQSDSFVAKTVLKSAVTQFVNFEGLNFTTYPVVQYTSGVLILELVGAWVVGDEVAITEVDARLNGESFENVDSIASWLYSNNVAGVTLDASLSIHANGANDAYTDLTDVEVEVDASNNYYVSTGSVPTPEKEFTLKYELTKLLTTDDVRLYRTQGGVA